MNLKACPVCGKLLVGKKSLNTFCSRSCSASRPNPTKVQNNLERRRKVCLNCKQIILHPKVYCNVTCQHAYQTLTRIESWLSGTIDLTTVSGCSATVRKYLLETSGHKCSKCGWNEVNTTSNKVPLEVNHIDGT